MNSARFVEDVIDVYAFSQRSGGWIKNPRYDIFEKFVETNIHRVIWDDDEYSITVEDSAIIIRGGWWKRSKKRLGLSIEHDLNRLKRIRDEKLKVPASSKIRVGVCSSSSPPPQKKERCTIS